MINDSDVYENAKGNYLTKNFLNQTIIIAPKRSKRPDSITSRQIETNKENNSSIPSFEKECIFCPGNEQKTPREIDRIMLNSNLWSARCFNNYYPTVHKKNKRSYGYHEIVVETPYHNKDYGNMNKHEISDSLLLIQKRFIEIQKDDKINFIAIFKNHGEKAGASQKHSHSQIIAINQVPEPIKVFETMTKKRNCTICKFFKYKKNILFSNKTSRVLVVDEQQFSHELIITTKNHKQFDKLDKEELVDLAESISFVAKKYNQIRNNNAHYNLLFYTHELNKKERISLNDESHFMIRAFLRDNLMAGFELLTDIVINTTNSKITKQLFEIKT
ncbi:MAG: hypothetical protein N3E37_04080 [Candidatus Micrarchaeota archaeon]|nr:hypothetical protein [Candidatus Micrarchaeota archaeon]